MNNCQKPLAPFSQLSELSLAETILPLPAFSLVLWDLTTFMLSVRLVSCFRGLPRRTPEAVPARRLVFHHQQKGLLIVCLNLKNYIKHVKTIQKHQHKSKTHTKHDFFLMTWLVDCQARATDKTGNDQADLAVVLVVGVSLPLSRMDDFTQLLPGWFSIMFVERRCP